MGLGNIAYDQKQYAAAAKMYQESCASCHDTGANRAPALDALRQMRPERVLDALEHGAMISMANRRFGLYRSDATIDRPAS